MFQHVFFGKFLLLDNLYLATSRFDPSWHHNCWRCSYQHYKNSLVSTEQGTPFRAHDLRTGSFTHRWFFSATKQSFEWRQYVLGTEVSFPSSHQIGHNLCQLQDSQPLAIFTWEKNTIIQRSWERNQFGWVRGGTNILRESIFLGKTDVRRPEGQLHHSVW